MLRRLLAGLAALLVTFAVGVTVPLARMIAGSATQTVYADRLADAEHYATIAGRAASLCRVALSIFHADEFRVQTVARPCRRASFAGRPAGQH